MNKVGLPCSERDHVWKRGEHDLFGFFPNKSLAISPGLPLVVILIFLLLLF
jgi:hypothetical protein